MNDYIIRGTAANDQVRFFAAYTKDVVETARQKHNTSPVATAALGRLLTAGAMMGSMCKNDSDVITLQIQCSGPIGGLTVTADSHGHVKGYAQNPVVLIPANSIGKLDVAGAIGKGVLSVIKDIGLKDPYVGQTDLVSGEIAEDLTYYFAVSEQTPSSVGLGVLMNKNNTVAQAGGYIIQLMPDVEEETIEILEKRLASIEPVTTLFEKGHSPESILAAILDGFEVELSEEKLPVCFHCNCSKKRMERALVSLGSKELDDIIKDGESIELHCHFCNSNYSFSIEELKQIKNSLKE